MATNDELEIEISFANEEVDKIEQELKSKEVIHFERAPDQLGLTGIEILYVCLLAAGFLYNLVVRIMRQWKCGVIVDARPKKISVKKDCALPRGSVLIIRKDGTQSEFKENQDIEIKEFMNGLTGKKK